MQQDGVTRKNGQADDNIFYLVATRSISVGVVLGMTIGVEDSSIL